MTDTEWGGMPNRETHMFQVDWENEQPGYHRLRDLAYTLLVDDQEISDAEMGERLVAEFRQHLAEHENRVWADQVETDIGDWDKVDREAVGEIVRDTLDDMLRGT